VHSPRAGAGSLGANYRVKAGQILPILTKTQISIRSKENLKSKLASHNLSHEDWHKIGTDRVLQTTVLENIFEKFLDYQEMFKKGRNKSTFWDKRHTVPSVFANSREVNFRKGSTEDPPCWSRPAEEVGEKRRMEDALSMFIQMDKQGNKKHVGRLSFCNTYFN
jgi:hypothetical protein